MSDDGHPESPDSSPPRDKPTPTTMLRILGGFLVVGLVLVAALFVIKKLKTDTPPELAASIGAKLELAAGEVVMVDGEGVAGDRLLSGTPLPLGATLETGEGARALIRLADGSRVFLNEQSAISLGEDTGITVSAGQVWLETPPLDRNREPLQHSVGPAGLVLTDGGASLTLTEGGATIYVAEGIASVTSPGGRADVRSGEQVLVDESEAPKPEPVAFWDDWTGGMADRRAGGQIGGGSGSLYAVDKFGPPGTPALPLSIQRQTVDVAIEGALAETRVDQRFFNPSERDVEGWYWFTIPEGAKLVGFAVETDGQLVEGEIVERKQAAATYEAAAVSNDNPALLEWIDDRTVRAKIYPVPALGERRIVVRYQQLLTEERGKLRYSYPLAGAEGDAPTIEEFALAVELRGDLGQKYAIATLDEATVSNDSRLITMRRTGFSPRADFELELTRKASEEPPPPLRLSEHEGDPDQARFVMLRWLPDLDFAAVPTPRADVVVVVDTSAFGDEAEHHSRIAVAEALLRSLSEDDKFALMAADLTAEVLYPAKGLEQATPEAITAALETLRAHRPGGATDLGAIFERTLNRVHEAEQPAVIYVGDGLATSGVRGADALAERLRRALTDSRARLFTVGVGPSVDESLLARLARVGGGDSLHVETPDEAVVRALELSGALKTPTITDLELDLGAGLDDRFDNATGKLARGQELVVLARTHHDLPKKVTIRGRLGGEAFEKEYAVTREVSALDFVVPKLWAAARVERLLGDGRGPEAVRGKVLALGLEYGLMTPFSSFLALESEAAYARQGVERRRRPWDFKLLGAVLPHQWEIEPDHPRDPFAEPGAGELLLGALTAPMGCSAAPADRKEEAPAKKRGSLFGGKDNDERPLEEATEADMEAGGQTRHKGEEGKMGKPSANEKSGLYAMKGPKDAVPQMARNFDSEPADDEAGGNWDRAAPMAEPPPAAPIPSSVVSEDSKGGGGAARAKRKRRPSRTASGYRGGEGEAPEREAEEAAPADDPFLDDLVDGLPADKSVRGDSGTIGGLHQGQTKPDSWAKKERRDWAPPRPPTTSPVARNQTLPCSDASARSLSQRKILWEQRLARAVDMVGRLRQFESAAGSCELENWRQQRVFLEMLQATASTEAEIDLLLSHFWTDSETKAFLARAMLRRLVDAKLIGAVERSMHGSRLDTKAIEQAAARATTAKEALALVEQALDKHADASEDERLPLDLLRIDLLFELGRVDDAIATGRKLRERGLITPVLAQRLGTLLVEAGEEDEAKRVYSEIVEYDPGSTFTRRLLGDIFLRHGWYQEAYHQYQDLVSLSGEPVDVIRTARAAAGAGRVDEGLRLLRKVAAGEGRPGPEDPRRYARLHAAVLLAQLLATEDEVPKEGLTRELKRLQLFDSPVTWTFVVWRDLEHPLTLGVEPLGPDASPAQRDAARKVTMRIHDAIAAGGTGLWACQRGGLDDLIVRHKGKVPRRAVNFERITVNWDGQKFEVDRSVGTIAARAARQGEEADGAEKEG